jgi:hypothetical protein
MVAGLTGRFDFKPRLIALNLAVVRLEAKPPSPTNVPMIWDLHRVGFDAPSTRVVLTFRESLDAARADDLSNYQLIGPGPDGRLGTRDDHLVPLRSGRYDSTTRQVILRRARRLPLRDHFELIVTGTRSYGLTSAGGAFRDDGGAGPGGDDVTDFGRECLGTAKAGVSRRRRPPWRASEAIRENRGLTDCRYRVSPHCRLPNRRLR